MMLLDSNIIIYAAQPQHEALRQFIAVHVPTVSLVSHVEVVGYHKLSDSDRQFLNVVANKGKRIIFDIQESLGVVLAVIRISHTTRS